MKAYIKEKIPVVLASVGYLFIVHKVINYIVDKAVDLFERTYIWEVERQC